MDNLHIFWKYEKYKNYTKSTPHSPVCKPNPKEPLDDEKINRKIQEANKLIERVRQTLGKIQTKQAEYPPRSQSSTDIEQTVEMLRKEAAELVSDELIITDESINSSDLTLPVSREDISDPEIKKPVDKSIRTNHPVIIVRESNVNLSANKRNDKTSKESESTTQIAGNRTPRISSIKRNITSGKNFDPLQVPIGFKVQRNEKINKTFVKDKSPYAREIVEEKLNPTFVKDKGPHAREFLEDRPMTRRKESEDDNIILEQALSDKFKTCPDIMTVEVTSSFDELKEKLQTISETTESGLSTPIKTKSAEATDMKKCACVNTESTAQDHSTQTNITIATASTMCNCNSYEEKAVQTVNNRNMTQNLSIEVIPPRPKSLQITNIYPAEIPPQNKLVIEKKSHMQSVSCKGVSIDPNKRRPLVIQPLPPIIINRAFIVQEVLKLSIEDGRTENAVPNSHNVVFIEIEDEEGSKHTIDVVLSPQRLDSEEDRKPGSSVCESTDTKLDFPIYARGSKLQFAMDSEEPTRENMTDNKKRFLTVQDNVQRLGICGSVHELLTGLVQERDIPFAKEVIGASYAVETGLSDVRIPGFTRSYLSAPNVSSHYRNQDVRDKLMVFKSYHLMDNPNTHEPIMENSFSLPNVTLIDEDVYRTYINPEPGPRFAASKQKVGFESKMVQCDESCLAKRTCMPLSSPMVFKNISEKESTSREIPTRSQQPSITENLKNTSINSRGRVVNDTGEYFNRTSQLDCMESVVTLERLKSFKSELYNSSKVALDEPESSMMAQQSETINQNSTPSEITVTISYSMSSDEKTSQTSLTEKEICSTNMDIIKSYSKNMNKDPTRSYQVLSSPKVLKIQEPNNEGSKKQIIDVADKDTIKRISEKMKSVDTTKSNPTLAMEKDSANEALDDFIKGLTVIDEVEKPSNESFDDKQVNYVFNDYPSHPYIKHLEVGPNGRYKDEAHLFTKTSYATPPKKQRKSNDFNPSRLKVKAATHVSSQGSALLSKNYEESPVLPSSNHQKQEDMEIGKDKIPTKQLKFHKMRKYSPEISNSETITTTPSNSISEGELRCKHSHSIGELHPCRQPLSTRLKKIIPLKKNSNYTKTIPLAVFEPVNDRRKKIDFNDPKVTIERRRNYFNNWVTYYVKPQDIYESSSSRTSENKN